VTTLPRNIRTLMALEEGASPFDYEAREEQASALAAAGRRVEKALAALEAHPKGADPDSQREDLLDTAGEAVWAFLVQRELCGLRDAAFVLREYRVPKEVTLRLGVVRKK